MFPTLYICFIFSSGDEHTWCGPYERCTCETKDMISTFKTRSYDIIFASIYVQHKPLNAVTLDKIHAGQMIPVSILH